MTDAELFLALGPHMRHTLDRPFRQVRMWREHDQHERWSALFSVAVTELAQELGEDRDDLWNRLVPYIMALDDETCSPEVTEVLDLLQRAWQRSEVILPVDGEHR